MKIITQMIYGISKKNQIHANKLKKYLETCDEKYLSDAEEQLKCYSDFLISNFNVDIQFIIDSYLTLVKDMMVDEIRFMRTGEYRYKTVKEVEKNIYSNKSYMFKYMVGLAVSQFFWENHNKIFNFFRKHIYSAKGDKYLEVGCGHGLFFVEAIKSDKYACCEAIDLSQTSIDITSRFIEGYFKKIPSNVHLTFKDVVEINFSEKYDFIAMGEVLEHVENPQKLINKVYEILAENGIAFISTCSNSPAVDHIFLFDSVNSIRKMFYLANLTVVDEVALLVKKMYLKNGEYREAVNYAAILRKARN